MAGKALEVTTRWEGDLRFVARNTAQGEVKMGSGEPERLSPMEMLLAGLAGCSAVDVVLILQKKRVPLVRFEVAVRGERRDEHPRVYTHIHMIYRFWADGLRPKDAEQAIRLSHEKYCSASAMLGAVAEITHEFHIYPAAQAKSEAA